MSKAQILFILLILAAAISKASQFECVANKALTQSTEDSIRITGELDSSLSLYNVVLSLISARDKSDHDLVRVNGPITADPEFHPGNSKLKGFQKYVLEKNQDSFLFFITATGDMTKAFVKLGFEGTFPRLEAVACKISDP